MVRLLLLQCGDSLCLCSPGAEGIILPERLFKKNNKSSICPECPVSMVTEACIVYFSALSSVCIFFIGLCLRLFFLLYTETYKDTQFHLLLFTFFGATKNAQFMIYNDLQRTGLNHE